MSRHVRMADCHPDRKHFARGQCKRCYQTANRADAAAHVASHGYGGYTNGCRCAVCTGAKAHYIRERRAAARQAGGIRAADGTSIEGVKHGARFAYEERGCRCEACCAGQRLRWTRDSKRRRDGQVAA